MPVGEERERLAATFDRATDLYHRARPEYPDEVYDHLAPAHRAAGPGRGCWRWGVATGKATLPLARRGYRITCVEPGAALATAARGGTWPAATST